MTAPHADCRGSLPYARCGDAITRCELRDDGELWVTNDEYSSRVNFCPFCGEQAPHRLRRVYVNEHVRAELLARLQWEADVGDVIWGDDDEADDVLLVAKRLCPPPP